MVVGLQRLLLPKGPARHGFTEGREETSRMQRKPIVPVRTEILSVAHDVLRRRNSARIIGISSARGDVRGLLNEYRQYMDEAERLLQRDGIRLSLEAVELIRAEWSDTLIEHHRQPLSQQE